MHFALECCFQIALRATELGYCLRDGFPQLRQFLRSKQNEGNQENDDHFLHANWSHRMPSFASNDSKGDWDESLLARDRQGLGQAVAPRPIWALAAASGDWACPIPPASPVDGPIFRAWCAGSFQRLAPDPQCSGSAPPLARLRAPAP